MCVETRRCYEGEWDKIIKMIFKNFITFAFEQRRPTSLNKQQTVNKAELLINILIMT